MMCLFVLKGSACKTAASKHVDEIDPRFQERIKSHRVKAQQINQMIQAHITAASATDTGYFSFDHLMSFGAPWKSKFHFGRT